MDRCWQRLLEQRRAVPESASTAQLRPAYATGVLWCLGLLLVGSIVLAASGGSPAQPKDGGGGALVGWSLIGAGPTVAVARAAWSFTRIWLPRAGLGVDGAVLSVRGWLVVSLAALTPGALAGAGQLALAVIGTVAVAGALHIYVQRQWLVRAALAIAPDAASRGPLYLTPGVPEAGGVCVAVVVAGILISGESLSLALSAATALSGPLLFATYGGALIALVARGSLLAIGAFLIGVGLIAWAAAPTLGGALELAAPARNGVMLAVIAFAGLCLELARRRAMVGWDAGGGPPLPSASR